MGRKAINLTNMQFGSLQVLERDYTKSTDHAYWKCKCLICGQEKSVKGSSLIHGYIKSCNCIRPERIEDLTGQTFGFWTVLGRNTEKIKLGHSVYWDCQCICGTIKPVRGDTLKKGESISCGCIKFSRGELKIKQILEDNNILFEQEKKFDNCKMPNSDILLRFDFYLPDYNTLIEYDGKQHFIFDDKTWNTKEQLIKTQKHDKFKNNWCKDNNITLIRIPYTYYNEITLKDLLPTNSNFIISTKEENNTNDS